MPSKKKSHSNDNQNGYEYKKDEKVLVLPKQPGEDIYEAKVLDRKMDKSKAPQYKIHYKGWNKRWDEWVNQQRLLKINASNRQTMSETNNQNKLLQQQQQQSQNGPSHRNNAHNSSSNDSDSNNSKSPSPASHGSNHSGRKRKLRGSSKGGASDNSNKRRKLNHGRNESGSDGTSSDDNDDDDNDNHNDDHHDTNNNKEKSSSSTSHHATRGGGDTSIPTSSSPSSRPLEISLPTALKRKLITDWENITKNHLLIDLPRKNGQKISEILKDFEQFAIEQGQDKNIVLEISRGIKDYFNQALQVTLLYKLERKQYEKIINKHSNLSMDQIYGVEHLCRLFVKLPQLLSPTDLDGDTRIILKQQIECIITFVLSHEKKYFNTKYISSNKS